MRWSAHLTLSHGSHHPGSQCRSRATLESSPLPSYMADPPLLLGGLCVNVAGFRPLRCIIAHLCTRQRFDGFPSPRLSYWLSGDCLLCDAVARRLSAVHFASGIAHAGCVALGCGGTAPKLNGAPACNGWYQSATSCTAPPVCRGSPVPMGWGSPLVVPFLRQGTSVSHVGAKLSVLAVEAQVEL